MSTELIKEEIFTKITLKGYQKDLITNEKNPFQVKAIKNTNKINYYHNEEQYSLKIIHPNMLVLTRENKEIKNIIYFEENKTIPSSYYLKAQDITLEIDIKTELLEITEFNIKVVYLVIDSNNKYEYKIEMSE